MTRVHGFLSVERTEQKGPDMRKDQGIVLLLVLFVSLLVTGVAPAVEVEIDLTIDGVAYELEELNGTTLGLILDVVKTEFDISTDYDVFLQMTAVATC